MATKAAPAYSFNDVYPLPIGVKVRLVEGRDFSTVLPRNSRIPCSVKRTYYTVKDNQSAVKVSIYEGEEQLVANNFSLGDFEMNLPPGTPKDEPFDVHMNLDDDGILHVKYEFRKNNTVKELIVNETKGRLTTAEISNFKMEELEFYTLSSEDLEY
ncbi:unnamed protein product [Allacma fusca]|uniref:Uncharacterized protein n=1 Tax=Allacma fusca TaxID=39272 RepID=A0A8J2M4B6_9HEXA|nr:unnamed protein product [Allacma fusca]